MAQDSFQKFFNFLRKGLLGHLVVLLLSPNLIRPREGHNLDSWVRISVAHFNQLEGDTQNTTTFSINPDNFFITRFR